MKVVITGGAGFLAWISTRPNSPNTGAVFDWFYALMRSV